jgi:DNA-directed RNA polymerase II subunit RPB2
MLTKDRLFEVSDAFRVHICDICGLMTPIAYVFSSLPPPLAILTHDRNLKKEQFECRPCHNKTKISQIHLPYAAKLLFQELAAMNIAARMFHKRSGVTMRT